MEHKAKTYFAEHEDDDVKGFTIIKTVEEYDVYHVAEKWTREGAEDKWLQYEIPASQLKARISDGKCEKKATLSDEQFEKVRDCIDLDSVTAVA